MRYEFLKIVQTETGEVAYLIDHQRGRVVLAPVEWLGEEVQKERFIPTERSPRTTGRVNALEYEGADRIEDERPPVKDRRNETVTKEELLELESEPRGKNPTQIVPRAFRGMMRPDGDELKRVI